MHGLPGPSGGGGLSPPAHAGASANPGSDSVERPTVAACARPLVLGGLEASLESDDLTWLGGTAELTGVLEWVGELDPTILLIELELDPPGVLETLARLQRAGPRVVVISEAWDYIGRITRLAGGCVSLGASAAGLRRTLQQVADGDGTFLAGEGGPRACARCGAGADAAALGDLPSELLTTRERQVLTHVASGYSTKGTAAKLGISHSTVAKYRQRLLRKLGVQNVAELTRYAIQQRLIEV